MSNQSRSEEKSLQQIATTRAMAHTFINFFVVVYFLSLDVVTGESHMFRPKPSQVAFSCVCPNHGALKRIVLNNEVECSSLTTLFIFRRGLYLQSYMYTSR